LWSRELLDAAGIYCGRVCDKCEAEKRAKFRPEIFEAGTLYSESGEEDDIGYEDDEREWEPEPWDDEDAMRNRMFERPGANSALRRETASNPRNLPCPTCGQPDKLTPKDKALGYQCDSCADRDERGGW
jgi:hypothetical protein